MYSAPMNSRVKGPWNISTVGPRFGSTKLAAAGTGCALLLAVLSALLLFGARPAQAKTETVLYNFTGGGDGANPQSNLTFDSAGNLYGTTPSGGLGYGTVFEVSPNGSGGWNETVLYTFTGGVDGENPAYSDVVFDSMGNLYGTAYGGGTNGYGVVFELSSVGGNWTATVLYSFAGGADGANPVNGLIMDPAGNLYGKTLYGGGGDGVVFELSRSGGGWKEQAIYTAETAASDAGLTMDAAGNIFGTTWSTVFELSPNGNGGWNPTVLHTFTGGARDGIGAQGTPVLDQAGNLYGTTYNGGRSNNGSIYKLSPGNKGWTEKILKFTFGSGSLGVRPFGGVVLDASGNLYGTSVFGGNGQGNIYELVAPVGKGAYTEKNLWKFYPPEAGNYPLGSLIVDSAGNFYGTTPAGGSYGYGVVFEFSPSAKPIPTTTTFTSSPNPSTYGQTVTFTATVTSSLGPPPDGQLVLFRDRYGAFAVAGLSNGTASSTISTLPVGATVTDAAYNGDWNLAHSKSKVVKQVVENAGK
jgi:uncharacterized repeat protein (TIGR03803 family)